MMEVSPDETDLITGFIARERAIVREQKREKAERQDLISTLQLVRDTEELSEDQMTELGLAVSRCHELAADAG